MILRPSYMEELRRFQAKNIIKVITGVRRAGKSTLLEFFAEELIEEGVKPEQVQFMNFDSLDFSEYTDYKKLYEHIKSRLVKRKMNYIFLDEIQMVSGFERVLASLQLLKNVDLYITGSNAFLLSSELATLLSGRYVEIKVLPLSFKEYFSGVKKLNVDKADAGKAFERYIEWGGFPYAHELGDQKAVMTYLEGIVNSVLVKDIMSRNNLSNAQLLQGLARFLIDSMGSVISINKIAGSLNSFGIKTTPATLTSYMDAFLQAFLFYRCDQYNISGKKMLAFNSKYYPVDPGLYRLFMGQRRPNFGARLEAAIYLELIRRGFEVFVGNLRDSEIDFRAVKDGVVSYFQVAYSIKDSKTFEREIKPLMSIDDNYEKIILTADEGSYNEDGVEIKNVAAWLLE